MVLEIILDSWFLLYLQSLLSVLIMNIWSGSVIWAGFFHVALSWLSFYLIKCFFIFFKIKNGIDDKLVLVFCFN
ncbi:hypothetical protein C1H71_15705 [Iodobacter fluviatilis]|uniref:Uncharacterized protein n=1 Tax=Iodobacter fluviatilis TaxID=537 RepID=A0A7G3GCD3_9NEIS|nr:hypothetical protein C1H71_15705 [Iodobacter fluviatilis]